MGEYYLCKLLIISPAFVYRFHAKFLFFIFIYINRHYRKYFHVHHARPSLYLSILLL